MIDHRYTAAVLNGRTMKGDLAGAYDLLMGLGCADARRVLLRAGYAVGDEKGKDFWAEAQAQVSRAAAAKVSGRRLIFNEMTARAGS